MAEKIFRWTTRLISVGYLAYFGLSIAVGVGFSGFGETPISSQEKLGNNLYTAALVVLVVLGVCILAGLRGVTGVIINAVLLIVFALLMTMGIRQLDDTEVISWLIAAILFVGVYICTLVFQSDKKY